MAAAGVEQVGDNERPTHWKDTVHEEEGGKDILGPRPQDGRNILQAEMNALIQRMEVLKDRPMPGFNATSLVGLPASDAAAEWNEAALALQTFTKGAGR